MAGIIEDYARDVRNEWTWDEGEPETAYDALRYVVMDLLEIQWDAVREDARAAYAESVGCEPSHDGQWAAWLVAGVCDELGIGD